MRKNRTADLGRRLWQAGNEATADDSTAVDAAAADQLDDLEMAYAVESATRDLAVAAGGRLIGYKVGLTAQPVRDTFGADEPAAGHLLADRLLEDGEPLATVGLFAPMAEVEIAFILGEALPGPRVTAQDVRNATAAVAPAFEIVDSRWRGGPRTLPMLVADNTNAARAAGAPGRPTRVSGPGEDHRHADDRLPYGAGKRVRRHGRPRRGGRMAGPAPAARRAAAGSR